MLIPLPQESLKTDGFFSNTTSRAKRRCHAAPEPAANDVRAGERTISRRLNLVGAREPRGKCGPLHCAQVVSAARVALDDVHTAMLHCSTLSAVLQPKPDGPSDSLTARHNAGSPYQHLGEIGRYVLEVCSRLGHAHPRLPASQGRCRAGSARRVWLTQLAAMFATAGACMQCACAAWVRIVHGVVSTP